MIKQSKNGRKILIQILIGVSFVIRLLSDAIPLIIYNERLSVLELLVLVLMSSFYVAFLAFAFGKNERVPLVVGYTILSLLNIYSLIRCLRTLATYSDIFTIEWLIEALVLMASHIALLVLILQRNENKAGKIIASEIAVAMASLGLLSQIVLIIKGQTIVWGVASQFGFTILEFVMLYYFKSAISLKDELIEAKNRFDNGEITEVEYCQLKESIMNRL